ncbi:glutaredoxin family protein [Azonexus caeni]|jgi:glutaredoxin|uniref:glutaredoxin family protein n=1 Tax=Azonexus caeni TaxID=266126 RepID=UPI003A8AE1A5
MSRLLVLCLLLCCAGAQAQAYRWTDAQGRTVISDEPPPGQARNVEKAGGKAQADDGLPFATKLAAQKHPVTLYTTADCIDECRQARELLQKRRVPFTETMAQTAAQFDELKALVGDTFVPSLKVGLRSFRGYNGAAYDNLLDLAGYPPLPGKKP